MQQDTPNIVLTLMDHLGIEAINAYGGHVRTSQSFHPKKVSCDDV